MPTVQRTLCTHHGPDGARDDPRRVQTRCVRDEAVPRDAAVAGLEPDETAVGGRLHRGVAVMARMGWRVGLGPGLTMRTEPPVSDAMDARAAPTWTDTALPPELPPGMRPDPVTARWPVGMHEHARAPGKRAQA